MTSPRPAGPPNGSRPTPDLLPRLEEIRGLVALLLPSAPVRWLRRSGLLPPVADRLVVGATADLLSRAGAAAPGDCADMLDGLTAGWGRVCDAGPHSPAGQRRLRTLAHDLDVVIDGLRAGDRHRPAPPWWIRRTRDSWVFALLEVVACFAGAALVVRHWLSTDWAVRAEELAGVGAKLSGQAVGAFDSPADHLLPVVALLLLTAGAVLGAVVFAGRLSRQLARASAWTLAALVPLHAVEGWLVDRAGSAGAPYRIWLQAVAFAGFALLPAAGTVAVLGAVTAVARMTGTWMYRYRLAHGRVAPLLPAWRSAPPEPGDDAHWYAGTAPPRPTGGLGICLSGGGIRSATFALGALQALQDPDPGDRTGRSELSRARYLAAVSGGAYTAGAFQLARRTTPPGGARLFHPGSPEFHHLRRHSAYLADGFREAAVAVLVVLRGAVFSMLFLAAVALDAGCWAGLLYHGAGRSADLTDPWQPVWGAVAATAVVAGIAVLLWLTSILASPKTGESRWRHRTRRWSRAGAVLTCAPVAVLAVVGAVVPLAGGASSALIAAAAPGPGNLAEGAAGGSAVAAFGVASTVAGLLHRRSTDVAKATRTVVEGAGKHWRRLGDTGKRALQWLAVYAGLGLVGGVHLFVFGLAAASVAHNGPDHRPAVTWGTPHWSLPTNRLSTFLLTGALVVLYLVLDETVIGLHPFYRRRLANAFAVRRVRPSWRPGETPRYEARAYDTDERTDLEDYGAATGGADFPQVIFCAAAHCSDPDRTPPGRHVLPFTFSSDAVGGPEVGWYRPGRLRPHLPHRLKGDLTVQTAMAVSGAAFASAAGDFHQAANVLLALTNARLGVWYANPAAYRDHGRDWWRARTPKIRRMSYLAREIFSWNAMTNALLFVSDGGRYDNLGLVELLRHRSDEIYCFDASSDEEAFAHSLARSIALAEDELGVEVTLDDPEPARPASAGAGPDTPRPIPADLADRMAARCVMTGTVSYPPLGTGLPAATGRLVVGRAVLDRDTPWEVLRHAAANPSFPYDVTGDQWFGAAKFDAYTTLGRHVGRAARKVLTNGRAAGSVPEQPAEPHLSDAAG